MIYIDDNDDMSANFILGNALQYLKKDSTEYNQTVNLINDLTKKLNGFDDEDLKDFNKRFSDRFDEFMIQNEE